MKVANTLGLSLGLGCFLAGCLSPPVEAPKTTVEQATGVSTEQNLKDKVDLLFLIDDSGSMAPKQARLRAAFPQLISVLNEFGSTTPASYHIGVVTSDLGAPGITCGSNRGGKLQAKGAAAAGCLGPTQGNYLVYDQKNPANSTIPAGQDLASTFTCMASVGDKGCGFEMQLEAVYRALHDNIAENSGFLRSDAILAVIFVTDEDDCSVDNGASDIFGANTMTYGPLTSYRCTRFGISCDSQFPLPSTPQASYASCEPATVAQGSKFSDITKYINFFTQPKSKGGLKENPKDVVLAAIDARSTPFGTGTGNSPDVCGQGVSTCTVLSHACTNPTDGAFFGDPAVRLNAVLAKSTGSTIASICDDDAAYKTALDAIGKKIVAALKPSCLSSPLKFIDEAGTKPDCDVQDITTVNGEDVHTVIPFCGDVANVTPCFKVAQTPDCPQICNPISGDYDKVGVQVDRGGKDAPPNTVLEVNCATVAIANEDPNKACIAKHGM